MPTSPQIDPETVEPIPAFWFRWLQGVTSVTNGRFVAAKLEKPALCIGQLWRSPKVGYGSGAGTRSLALVDSNVAHTSL